MNRLFLLLFGMVTFVAHAQVPDYVPTDGLVGWYPLDGNALDLSALSNNGSVHGATPTQDRYGNESGALSFDMNDWSWGSGGNWVYIPFHEEFNTPEVTVSTWVKRNSGGYEAVPQGLSVACRFQYGYSNPNGESWVLSIGNDDSSIGSKFAGYIIQQSPSPAINISSTSPEETPLQEWIMLTMTWDGDTLKLFQDGLLVSETIEPGFEMNSIGSSGISLGMSVQANGHWGPLDGDLDDFAVWNRALTEAEILLLHTTETPDVPGCTDPTACNYDEEATEDDGSCVSDLASSLDLPEQIVLAGGESETISAGPDFTDVYWHRSHSISWLEGNDLTISSPGEYVVHAAVSGCQDTVICWEGSCGNNPDIQLPEGFVFTDLEIALYGTPGGSCPDIVQGSCGFEVTEQIYPHVVGRTFIDGVFPGFTDQCVGTCKYVSLRAIASPCITDTIDVIPAGLCDATITVENNTASLTIDIPAVADINVHNFNMTFFGGYSHTIPVLSAGQLYRAKLSGTWSAGAGAGNARDACYRLEDESPYIGFSWNGIYSGVSTNYIRPYPDGFNASHEYEVYFIGDGLNSVAWNYCCLYDDSGSISWEIEEVNEFEASISWSNGQVGPIATFDGQSMLTATVTAAGVSCSYDVFNTVPGCTDPTACNYNEEATEDDGSCQFAPDFVGNDTIILTCPGTSIQFPNELGQGDPYLFNSGSPNPWPAGSLEAGGAIPLGVFGTPSNFSLAFSVNPSPEQNGHSIMFDASHGGSSNWVLQNLGDGWRFLGHEIPLTAGVWQDVLITYSGCDVNFYVDGELTTQLTHCINYSGNPSWYMGNWPEGGRRFTGSIDDVLYSHEVLTPEAVAMGADAPGAVQFFAFDEGEGPDTMEQISMASSPLNGWAWEAQATSDGTIAWDGVDDIEMLTFGQDTTLTYVWSNDFCEASGAVTVVIITNLGCTDPDACNYSPDAECDDDSCIYPLLDGTDCETGGIYCGEGTVWDPTLQACVGFNDCPSDLNGNGAVEVTDLLMVLADFGSECPPEVAEWTCGEPVNYQGYDYTTVLIGEQCWFAENLRNEQYANGDAIPGDLNASEWSNMSEGAQAVYDDSPENLMLYGRLYNWYTVDDPRSLCPSGWGIPSDDEWKQMEMSIGMSSSQANAVGWRGIQGDMMRSSATDNPPWTGSNSSGFSGLNGGRRTPDGSYFNDSNGVEGHGIGIWWSSTSATELTSWGRALGHNQIGVDRNSGTYGYSKQGGASIRCLKDE